MRNNTKLKALLMKYTVSFDMDDDGMFKLVLCSKSNGEAQVFEGKSYGAVLSRAYSYLLIQLRSGL